ncbi:hypothetical protein FHX82_004785 [Amycolatopsis bartoniae]|uniref:Transglycosylase SLT domain-containing protein n=1 Tax=Amycolatopsis bartoniae TaxID=941986 RepID=A0A8H9INS4_9PSEU|nr:transglycosylase SLT domain-containing protein [Amycolatopsis bartoniae]MBB2937709.1 hypothetical protein [Amycolatopsis bartoniae]GHF40094.1 hypothetical protein GCM10017566_11840 [Amycolatopsis bartoniae]
MGNHCANTRARRKNSPYSPPRHRAPVSRNLARTTVSAGVLALSVTGSAAPVALAGTDTPPAPVVAASAPLPVASVLGVPGTTAADPGVVLPLAQPKSAAPKVEAPPQPPAGSAEPVGDQVTQWITEAVEILRAQGIPVSTEDIPAIRTVIEKESDGDPEAVNRWDANARAGHPSKGLMQCTDFTFEANKLPGHDDILDPVDNIIAGVRYTIGRYGAFSEHPGIRSINSGGGYRGY